MAVLRWVKENVLAVVAAFAAIAASIAFWQYQRRKVGSLKDAVAVARAKNEIVKHVERKEALKAKAEDTRAQEDELDKEIVATKRKVVDIKRATEVMSDDEVAAEFDRLYRRPL